jgi:hypothetical protein
VSNQKKRPGIYLGERWLKPAGPDGCICCRTCRGAGGAPWCEECGRAGQGTELPIDDAAILPSKEHP